METVRIIEAGRMAEPAHGPAGTSLGRGKPSRGACRRDGVRVRVDPLDGLVPRRPRQHARLDAVDAAVFAVAFMVVMALWIFWDAYRDSEERAADWLSTRPGVATWRQLAADYGPRAINRDVVPSVLPRMLAVSATGSRAPSAPDPGMPHGMWAIQWNMEVWLGSERHIYVLGPTRSGKTVSVVIPAVVEAPGFVLATSTRRGHHQNDALPA